MVPLEIEGCLTKKQQTWKLWYLSHRKDRLQYAKDYRTNHHDERLNYEKDWYRKNRNKKVIKVKQWQRNNKEKVKGYNKLSRWLNGKTFGKGFGFLQGTGICIFCGEINPFALENHHVFGKGSISISLCGTCHLMIHRSMPRAMLEERMDYL